MNIEELRIGNLINFSSNGIVKRKKVDIGFFIQNMDNAGLNYWKPIVITQSLLDKLEIKKHVQMDPKGGILIFNKLYTHVFYLHQLQNFWFSVVNEEINISKL